jgi:hypothetical protein
MRALKRLCVSVCAWLYCTRPRMQQCAPLLHQTFASFSCEEMFACDMLCVVVLTN